MTTAKYDNNDGRLRGHKGVARRLRIWTLDPHCKMCGRLTDYPHEFNVDHIVPLHKGGLDEDKNLQVLCVPCHRLKTEKDMGHAEPLKFDPQGMVIW